MERVRGTERKKRGMAVGLSRRGRNPEKWRRRGKKKRKKEEI